MPEYHGGCTCAALRYTLTLNDPSTEARTTLCHCVSCKRTFGGAYGLTTKIAVTAFYVFKGLPKLFVQDDNGLHREFCDICGTIICTYGRAVMHEFRYICTGTLDDGPDALPPKGEFFTSQRNAWVAPVPGAFQRFHIEQ